jgi:hypothetical protein
VKVPGVASSYLVSAFRGQSQSIEFGKGYGFTETLAPDKVYNYRFDTREIKKPLQEAVTSCGWIYKRRGLRQIVNPTIIC